MCSHWDIQNRSQRLLDYDHCLVNWTLHYMLNRIESMPLKSSNYFSISDIWPQVTYLPMHQLHTINLCCPWPKSAWVHTFCGYIVLRAYLAKTCEYISSLQLLKMYPAYKNLEWKNQLTAPFQFCPPDYQSSRQGEKPLLFGFTNPDLNNILLISFR